MKKQIPGGIVFVVLLIAAAAILTTEYLLISDAYETANQKAVPEKMQVPEGVTCIQWNETDGDISMQKLSACLSELEPSVAVIKEKDLQWKDICPDNFWVESFSVTSYDNADFKLYNFKYYDDADQNKKMTAAVEAEVRKITDAVKAQSKGDEWDDILFVHDELIRNTEFVEQETNADHTHDLYGALVNHKAVCQGYTYAFSYILRKLGYKCTDIYSKEHIWSKIESLKTGEKYIDVTWDDYNNCDRNGQPYIHHDFFCLTKKEMESFDEHKPEDDGDNEFNGAVGDNYYRKKNYYIPKNDEMAFRACALEQFEQGKNLLEFRFESREDFDRAGDWTMAILKELGYTEKHYYVYSKPELLTYSAGLYTPPEKAAE